MGFKLRGVIRCGACGKPRGLGVHLCNPGRRKRRPSRVQNPVTWECSACHKPRGLRHTCSPVRGDFKRRKRKQATAERRRKRKAATARRAERRRQAAAQRRERARERKRTAGGRTRPARPRDESHVAGLCGDRDCPKYACKNYWQGMDDCPLPHGGD